MFYIQELRKSENDDEHQADKTGRNLWVGRFLRTKIAIETKAKENMPENRI